MAKYKVSYCQTHEEIVHVNYLVSGFVEADSFEEVETLIESGNIADELNDNETITYEEIDREGVETTEQFEITDPEITLEDSNA